jgi:hypothetical protein
MYAITETCISRHIIDADELNDKDPRYRGVLVVSKIERLVERIPRTDAPMRRGPRQPGIDLDMEGEKQRYMASRIVTKSIT